MWSRRIAARPAAAGSGTLTWRPKRPGRSSAGSSTSSRFVAAMQTTRSVVENPSSSTRIWFSVCSRSPLPSPEVRERPTASISSMKMTAPPSWLRARSKSSRTRLAPTPTNFSTKSLPLVAKKGTPASPASAFASSVLPVPGSPWRMTPDGGFAPISSKRFGLAEEVDDLGELLDRLVAAGDVVEALVRHGSQLRRRAERGVRAAEHAATAAAAGLGGAALDEHEHEPDHGDEDERGQQQGEHGGAGVALAGAGVGDPNVDALAGELLEQPRRRRRAAGSGRACRSRR